MKDGLLLSSYCLVCTHVSTGYSREYAPRIDTRGPCWLSSHSFFILGLESEIVNLQEPTHLNLKGFLTRAGWLNQYCESRFNRSKLPNHLLYLLIVQLTCFQGSYVRKAYLLHGTRGMGLEAPSSDKSEGRVPAVVLNAHCIECALYKMRTVI